MATSKQNTEWSDHAITGEKVTSVTAHIVKSVAVQMSITEMNTLIDSFGVDYNNLTTTQRAIHAEFVQAVESLR